MEILGLLNKKYYSIDKDAEQITVNGKTYMPIPLTCSVPDWEVIDNATYEDFENVNFPIKATITGWVNKNGYLSYQCEGSGKFFSVSPKYVTITSYWGG